MLRIASREVFLLRYNSVITPPLLYTLPSVPFQQIYWMHARVCAHAHVYTLAPCTLHSTDTTRKLTPRHLDLESAKGSLRQLMDGV